MSFMNETLLATTRMFKSLCVFSIVSRGFGALSLMVLPHLSLLIIIHIHMKIVLRRSPCAKHAMAEEETLHEGIYGASWAQGHPTRTFRSPSMSELLCREINKRGEDFMDDGTAMNKLVS